MTLELARKIAKPGQYIMCLLSGSRYGEPVAWRIVNEEQRMLMSSSWITWERKD